MAQKSGFFNSVDGDRSYNSADMNNIFAGIRSNGVIANELQELETSVAASENEMILNVSPGKAIVNGKWFHNSAYELLTIEPGDTNYRIDTLILRLSETDRSITLAIKKGTPATSPVAPTLTDTTTVKEIALYNVAVTAGASTASGITLTDVREYSAVSCTLKTLLWENPNTLVSFAGQEVILSESVDNFEMILVESGSLRSLGNNLNYFDILNDTAQSGESLKVTMAKRAYTFNGNIALFDDTYATTFTVGPDGTTTFDFSSTQNQDLKPTAIYGINRIK